MRFLLDTNAVIALMKAEPAITGKMQDFDPADFGISAIVAHELFFGAYKSERRAQNLERVEALRFEVLAFDIEDSRCSGMVRAALQQAGAPIGPYDVLIAGQALARDLTLITHNSREFQRVEGLRALDWQG